MGINWQLMPIYGHKYVDKSPPQQKVDDDGFTEVAERKRGSNRNKYNQRGTTPGSYRNNNNGGGRGGSNPRYVILANFVEFLFVGSCKL